MIPVQLNAGTLNEALSEVHVGELVRSLLAKYSNTNAIAVPVVYVRAPVGG